MKRISNSMLISGYSTTVWARSRTIQHVRQHSVMVDDTRSYSSFGNERKSLEKSSQLLSTMIASISVTTLENSSMLVWSPEQVRPKMVMDDRHSTKLRISDAKRSMQMFEISLVQISQGNTSRVPVHPVCRRRR